MLIEKTEFRVSCLLFDMDGTLLDSQAPMIRAYAEWADCRGLDLAMVLRVCQGRRVIDTVRALAPAGVDHDADAAALSDRERNDVEGVVEIPGAGAFLRSIPTGRWAVVTSADRVLATNRMKAAGLPIPPLLTTADDIAKGKPAPDGFLMAARTLGAEPKSAAVFEDSAAGITAGLQAGSVVIAIRSTLSAAQIESLAPRGYIDNMIGLSVRSEAQQLILRIA